MQEMSTPAMVLVYLTSTPTGFKALCLIQFGPKLITSAPQLKHNNPHFYYAIFIDKY